MVAYVISPSKPLRPPLGVYDGTWWHHLPGGSAWVTCLSRPSSQHSTPSGPALQLVFLPGHPASPGSWGSTVTMSRCRGLWPARSFSVFCSGRKSPQWVSRRIKQYWAHWTAKDVFLKIVGYEFIFSYFTSIRTTWYLASFDGVFFFESSFLVAFYFLPNCSG